MVRKSDPLLRKLHMSALIANAKTVQEIPTQEFTLSLDVEGLNNKARSLIQVWGDDSMGVKLLTICITTGSVKGQAAVVVDLLPREALELANVLSTLAYKIEELTRGANPQTT